MLQGRNNVTEWISALPGGAADNDPWLSYWRGMCFFPADMPHARDHFEKAFQSRVDTEDRRKISGLVEPLDCSDRREPFADIDELGAVLNRHSDGQEKRFKPGNRKIRTVVSKDENRS